MGNNVSLSNCDTSLTNMGNNVSQMNSRQRFAARCIDDTEFETVIDKDMIIYKSKLADVTKIFKGDRQLTTLMEPVFILTLNHDTILDKYRIGKMKFLKSTADQQAITRAKAKKCWNFSDSLLLKAVNIQTQDPDDRAVIVIRLLIIKVSLEFDWELDFDEITDNLNEITDNLEKIKDLSQNL
jgi:hypothetical protein